MKHIISLSLLLLAFLHAGAKNYTVYLKSGSIVPQETGTHAQLSNTNIVGNKHYCFIQFKDIPTEVQKTALAQQGISLFNYIPGSTYMAALPTTLTLSKLNNDNIRAVFDIAPLHKLDEFLAKKQYPQWAMQGNGKIELMVIHQPDINHAQVKEWLGNTGVTVLHSLKDIDAYRIVADISQIDAIAALPYIYFIEAFDSNPEPDNLSGRTNHRSNMILTNYANGLKYDGTGVHVALNDDGVIGPHDDYKGRIIDQYIAFNNGNHGDHCAGTIFGAGNISPDAKGMAPGAMLGVYGVSGSFASVYQAFDSINNHYLDNEIRITSTSYSNGNNAGYTSLAQLMDIQIAAMPELMHVFSAGNAGGSNFGYGAGAGWGNITGGHKQGKTVMTTGNLTSSDGLANSSSRGPAHDGRIKPDICAVGTSVYSTVDVNAYAFKTGTSMACPGIAGVLAQLYHAYKEENSGSNPKSALIKAIMLNTADDLGNPGPDYKFGWGRVNAYRAYKTIKAKNYTSDNITQASTKNHTITVPANVKELRVMVYWPDYRAAVSASKALVNDLDMLVIDGSNNQTKPWTLDPTPVVAQLNANAVRGTDTLNNMEQVTITNPTAGTYTVRVIGTEVPQGPQEYYVVYEFVTDEITITYPNGGEGFQPSSTETIRWDAYGTSGNFTLEYSLNNGSSWTTISNSISGALRQYNWAVPTVAATGQAQMRISRSGQSDVTDANFSIIGNTDNLNVHWVCVDSMQVSFDAVSGATGYYVSVLGTKYMDSVAYCPTNTCVVKNIDTRTGGRFTVTALGPNGARSKPALAVVYGAAPINCSAPEDVAVETFVTPATNTVVDCQAGTTFDFVRVGIRNNSFQPIGSGFTFNYSVNGGTPIVHNYSNSIGTGFRDTVAFSTPLNLTTPGTYDIKAWLDWNSPRNTILSTDTITMQKTIVHPGTMVDKKPEDFESFSLCATTPDCGLTICPLNGDWTNESNTIDDIDWRIHSGPTPSRIATGNTGPQQDHNPGNNIGQYAYLEASGCNEQEGLLITPCIEVTSSDYVIAFAYHMFGSDMGELHIDALVNGVWKKDIVSALSGNMGDQWHPTIVWLHSFLGEKINIGFRGVTGKGDLSDIAIDDISVYIAENITDVNNNIAANIYPNPSDGIYNLNISGMDGDVELTVTDINGRVLQVKTLVAQSKHMSTAIDMSQQAPGVYLLTIKHEQGTINKKLVKM